MSMGSKGEKKSGLVGEKSHTVYSANWKLDAMLDKELGMLDTSKRRVEHRISMDQVVTKKRFEMKLHHSKVFHARMKGDRAMLKKLITRDNYNFNTNTSSADVLNKRRDKDLEKKRIQHRQSQDKMMTLRSPTPATVTPGARELPERPRADAAATESPRLNGHAAVSKIRPMTAIERITSAKIMSGRSNKSRPVTAAPNGTITDLKPASAYVGVQVPKSNKIRTIPEATAITKYMKDSHHYEPSEPVKDKGSKEIIIEITKAEDEQPREPLNPQMNGDQNIVPVEMGNDVGVSSPDHDTSGRVEDFEGPAPDPRGNTNALNVKKSSLRPSSAVASKSSDRKKLRPTTAHGTRSNSSKQSEPVVSETPQTARPRSSVTICDPGDQSDNESTVSTSRRSRSGHRKGSSKSCRKSAGSIFTEQKEITIKDIDEARRKQAKHQERISDYVKTIDGVKTDPDLIVDYYMARLLEESSISATKKNVERIRDMPDSDYDKDLSKRSIGDLAANTITFRDINRNFDDYKYDPFTPLHPTSMGFGLKRHESKVSTPTNAWQAEEPDLDHVDPA